MAVYIYCVKEDITRSTSILGRTFENEWFRLAPDGRVTIKGSNGAGYAWDGCSPKVKIKDIYFGTPEGVLNFSTSRSKTYYASLVHDVFYQFSRQLRGIVRRKEVDREFYRILKADGFRLARLYYWFVHGLGGIWWGRRA